jgi:hypothetical protein
MDRLFEQLERRQPGDTVTLGVWRQGSRRDVRTRLGSPE